MLKIPFLFFLLTLLIFIFLTIPPFNILIISFFFLLIIYSVFLICSFIFSKKSSAIISLFVFLILILQMLKALDFINFAILLSFIIMLMIFLKQK